MADPVTIIAAATQLLTAATSSAQLAARAIDAAHAGDLEEAQAYLTEARYRWQAGSDAWDAADAAGGAAPGPD